MELNDKTFLLFQLREKSRYPPKQFYNINYWSGFFGMIVPIFLIWAIPILFFFIFIFSTINRKHVFSI